jgi:hypothetical protein
VTVTMTATATATATAIATETETAIASGIAVAHGPDRRAGDVRLPVPVLLLTMTTTASMMSTAACPKVHGDAGAVDGATRMKFFLRTPPTGFARLAAPLISENEPIVSLAGDHVQQVLLLQVWDGLARVCSCK